MPPFVVGLLVLMCLCCSPQNPAFVAQRETLLLPHEFSIVLLSSIKETGGTPDSPHSGVVERLMSPQQTSLSKRKVRKRSVTPSVPQGSLLLKKKIGTKVFLVSCLCY